MARILTIEEKKELKIWAKANNIKIANKEMIFGNGFWAGGDIADLKAALLGLEDVAKFREAARAAMTSNHVAYDVCAHLGNENGNELIGYEGKEYWVPTSSMIYINGFRAINKKYLI